MGPYSNYFLNNCFPDVFFFPLYINLALPVISFGKKYSLTLKQIKYGIMKSFWALNDFTYTHINYKEICSSIIQLKNMKLTNYLLQLKTNGYS